MTHFTFCGEKYCPVVAFSELTQLAANWLKEFEIQEEDELTFSVKDDTDAEEEEDEGNEDHDEEERKSSIKATFTATRFVRYYLYTR